MSAALASEPWIVPRIKVLHAANLHETRRFNRHCRMPKNIFDCPEEYIDTLIQTVCIALFREYGVLPPSRQTPKKGASVLADAGSNAPRLQKLPAPPTAGGAGFPAALAAIKSTYRRRSA